MKEYELAIILHPDLEIDQKSALAKVEKLVEAAGASIVAKEELGKQKLAFPIAKQSHGLYLFYRINMEPTAAPELNNTLILADEVLRHLVVMVPRVVEEETKPLKPAAKTRTSSKTATKVSK